MKAKVTATLLTMMSMPMVSHAHAGIQHTDWSLMREPVEPTKTVEKPVHSTTSSSLGKRINCIATKADGSVIVNESLTDLLRQLGYSRDEMWGKQDKLAWAWYRINNAKFKRGEIVELDGVKYQRI